MRLNRRLNSVRGGNSRAAATESSHLIPPTPYKSMFYHVYTCGDALCSEQVWEFVLPSRQVTSDLFLWHQMTNKHNKHMRWHKELTSQTVTSSLNQSSVNGNRCAKGFTWRHRLHFQQWNTTFWLLFIHLKHSTRTVKLLLSQYFRINSSGHSG